MSFLTEDRCQQQSASAVKSPLSRSFPVKKRLCLNRSTDTAGRVCAGGVLRATVAVTARHFATAAQHQAFAQQLAAAHPASRRHDNFRRNSNQTTYARQSTHCAWLVLQGSGNASRPRRANLLCAMAHLRLGDARLLCGRGAADQLSNRGVTASLAAIAASQQFGRPGSQHILEPRSAGGGPTGQHPWAVQ